MNRLRKYGQQPYDVAIIHGGPGAAGEVAPVARELSSICGVLEPLQREVTLEGQVQELRSVLVENGDIPLSLVGFSWGAMLGYILAAQYPALIKRLILIGSGPFDEKYATHIMETRLDQLNVTEVKEVMDITTALEDPATSEKNRLMARLGKLMMKADSYDPLPQEDEILECRYDIYHNVWAQASEMRGIGRLLEMGRAIKCPVVAFHGDHDPHPAVGVEVPLSGVLQDFRFILIKNCGHYPWRERQARKGFFILLKKELFT